MARGKGVRAKGNRIEVNLSWGGDRRSFTVDRKPTQANIAAIQRQKDDARVRLQGGETLDALIAEIKGELPVSDQHTLGFWAQHYLDVVAPDMDDVADSTLMGYESLYNSHWMPFDGRNIHGLLLVELQDHLSKKKIKKKTKREALSLLKRIFAVAKVDTLEEWIIKKTKRDATPEPDPYSAEERDALLAALHDMGRARVDDMIAYRYFYTGFYTGMRTGELLGVHWHDFRGTSMHVWQSMVRRKMQAHTKTKRRDVLLTDGNIALLKDAHNPTRLKREHIFLTPEGHIFRDADWLMERWDRAHKKAKVRKRTGLYPWRHTYISLALSRGIPIGQVAAQAGNSPVIIGKHYFKWIPTKADSELLRKQLQEAVK